MRRKTIYFLLIGIVLAAVVGPAPPGLAAQNMGAKEMRLAGGSRGEVPFPHLDHQSRLDDCNVCHSLFPQAKDSVEALKAEGKLKGKQVMNKLCIKCHKAEKRAGKPAGPTTCAKCHVREN
jgi:hypothetical protein